MRSRIIDRLRAEQFNPSALGPWVNPFFLARRELWRTLSTLAPQLSGVLLDVGCGVQPYRSLFTVEKYIGLDVNFPTSERTNKVDVVFDGAQFPLARQSVDSVLCSQVLEHVFHGDAFVREIHRVLKPGGALLLTVPFLWDEHEQPHDFARYSSFGLDDLLQRNGFDVIEHHKLGANVSALFQLANAYLQKKLRTPSRAVNVLACAAFMAPVTLAGLAARAVLPGNDDLFLDNVVLARPRHAASP